jgi:DNA-binding CsgD family transcriptional regulator
MARKKEGSIQESSDELRTLLRIYSGTKCEQRLQMLMLLSDNSALTVDEVAAEMACSERTVRRWWKLYQEGGIPVLLGTNGTQSLKSPAHRHAGAHSLICPPVLKFLNGLPVTDDTVKWITTFREGLQRLLGDVDQVAVSVETECDLYSLEGSAMEFFLTEHIPEVRSLRHATRVTTQRLDRPPGELLLESLRRQAFPLDNYHPPLWFDYHVVNGEYLGTIILLRDRHAPVISERSRTLMRQLEPFLIFLLSDCIERRRRQGPDIRLFAEIVDSVSKAEGLRPREQEVMLHHLLGRNYEEIGRQLHISTSAVRKHVNAIHRKSGVKNVTELLARHITPLGEHRELVAGS